MSGKGGDSELQAIQQLIAALEPLDQDARSRVVEYVFGRLGIARKPRAHDISSVISDIPTLSSPGPLQGPVDIRSLTEEKSPRSATEMAAIAAYYLSELAPANQRKHEINAADVTKLFKQAGFPLPGTPKMTLVHAKNAGYFDPGSSRGSYALNPVGYNLVAHKLPLSESDTRPSRARKPPAKSEAARRTRSKKKSGRKHK